MNPSSERAYRAHPHVSLVVPWLSLGVLSIASPAPAQDAPEPFDFYARGPYRGQVPKPSHILGFEPGDYHAVYGEMLQVTDTIAQTAADRVRIFSYGRSVEGRPLRILVISAPENIARLEEIRAQVARLADPRATSQAQAGAIARDNPVIVWLNYANDGNESAAFESAMLTAYELAASEHPDVLEVLRNVVVIVNPAHNPESHERYVAWYNAMGVGDSAHIAMEHNPYWSLSTNNNHYQIDLNRDFLAQSQRETQAIVAAFLRWNPQVVVDHHGETEQYFFPPTARPMIPTLPWAMERKWEEVFGRANAAAFDQHGWSYYVRHIFDYYYPGYADVWPALNGATGMTYETFAGGDLGYRWRKQDGSVATLRDGIAQHFTASFATLQAAAANREARLRDYYEFRRSGMAEARAKPYARFVLLPGHDAERTGRLVEILLRSGVEVRRSDRPFRSERARGYVDARRVEREFPAGAYVIDLAQPQARLIETLLAPELSLDSTFIREQMAARARNARRGDAAAKEEYEFYDITAWSLPLSFGIDAYWTEDAGPVAGAILSAGTDPSSQAWQPPWLIPARRPVDLPAALAETVSGGVDGRAASAYVFAYDRNGAARLAIALLKEGYRVAVALGDLRAGEVRYPRGTLVVRVGRNPATLHVRVAELAREFGVPVRALATAYIEEGKTGVGSETVIGIDLPRVAVLAGGPVSERGYGALRYTLAREFGLPFTAVRIDQLDELDLRNYDVVILPPGSRSGYGDALGEGEVKRLKEWVEEGGVIVGLADGAAFLAEEKIGLTSSRIVGEEDDEEEATADTAAYMPPAAGVTAPIASPGGGETEPLEVPGAIFRAAVDRTHPLTFGYETDEIAVTLWGDRFFTLSEEGSNPVVFAADRLAIAGFIWPENTEKFLKGTAYLVDEPNGSGRAILFAADPNFRLLWPSLSRLFLNALLFGPHLD